ncbi:hypothetical protein [Nocardioides sp. LHG3406-4]|uniref:hypothetical protein n=1 Tax=Nocardioides sp. LHG3406-4 TaxID=2804575 RepID=UPI003CFA1047
MGRIVARYDYTDSKGNPTFRKIRREGKRFQMRCACWQDSKGVWHYRDGVPDEKFNLWIRALYKLPEVVAALRVDATVWWCEGEKDTESLIALGLTATTTPNPSDLWDDQARWFTRYRSQSEVIVVCDQDEHGGWWGWERYTALIRVGVDPRRITVIAPRSPLHKDVTDVIEATGSLDAVRVVRLDRLEACAARYTATRAVRYAAYASPAPPETE